MEVLDKFMEAVDKLNYSAGTKSSYRGIITNHLAGILPKNEAAAFVIDRFEHWRETGELVRADNYAKKRCPKKTFRQRFDEAEAVAEAKKKAKVELWDYIYNCPAAYVDSHCAVWR